MPLPPVGERLYQRGAFSLASPLYCNGCGPVDSFYIVAVDTDAFRVEGICRVGYTGPCMARLLRRVGGVEVVLAYEDDRQIPDSGQIKSFIKRVKINPVKRIANNTILKWVSIFSL